MEGVNTRHVSLRSHLLKLSKVESAKYGVGQPVGTVFPI